MNFSLVYLGNRFFYRIFDFIHDWYLGSFLYIGRHTINFLESLDQAFGLRVTIRNIFEPLYQDHTIVGHILGFIFRSLRILIAAFIYFFVASLAGTIYFIWALIPIFIIF